MSHSNCCITWTFVEVTILGVLAALQINIFVYKTIFWTKCEGVFQSQQINSMNLLISVPTALISQLLDSTVNRINFVFLY